LLNKRLVRLNGIAQRLCTRRLRQVLLPLPILLQLATRQMTEVMEHRLNQAKAIQDRDLHPFPVRRLIPVTQDLDLLPLQVLLLAVLSSAVPLFSQGATLPATVPVQRLPQSVTVPAVWRRHRWQADITAQYLMAMAAELVTLMTITTRMLLLAPHQLRTAPPVRRVRMGMLHHRFRVSKPAPPERPTAQMITTMRVIRLPRARMVLLLLQVHWGQVSFRLVRRQKK
jgi:hypothetical protein